MSFETHHHVSSCNDALMSFTALKEHKRKERLMSLSLFTHLLLHVSIWDVPELLDRFAVFLTKVPQFAAVQMTELLHGDFAAHFCSP